MVTSISKSSEFHQLPYGLSWFLSSSSRVFHVLPFLVWNLTGHLRSFEFDLRLVATYLPKKIQPWSSVGWKMIDKISRHLWKNMTWRMVNEKTWWTKHQQKVFKRSTPRYHHQTWICVRLLPVQHSKVYIYRRNTQNNHENATFPTIFQSDRANWHHILWGQRTKTNKSPFTGIAWSMARYSKATSKNGVNLDLPPT